MQSVGPVCWLWWHTKEGYQETLARLAIQSMSQLCDRLLIPSAGRILGSALVYVCGCVWAYVHMFENACRDQWSTMSSIPQVLSTLLLDARSVTLAWNWLNRLG